MPAECQSLAQCLDPNQTFNLWVESADHSIKNSVLIRGTDDGLQLFIQSPTAETESATTLRIQIGDDQSTLFVYQPPGHRTSTNTKLKLQGPSGRDIYELGAGERTEPYGIGSAIKYRDWRIQRNGDGLMDLVYGEDWASFRWIAVPESDAEGDAKQWALWWTRPCAANVDCFDGEVVVSVSVKPEQSDAKSEL